MFNMCKPYIKEHSWIWAGGDTVSTPYIGQPCTCGGMLHQGRGKEAVLNVSFFEEIEEIQNAAIEDFLNFEKSE